VTSVEECLKLFGLGRDANLDDVKKAYRKLAKLHHPDRFDDGQKENKEKAMAGINAAYRIIVSYFKNQKEKSIAGTRKTGKGSVPENDYTLYKEGVRLYDLYFDSFFELFSKRKLKTAGEKLNNLLTAKSLFIRLLRDYPKSVWVFDSEKKLERIAKAVEVIEKTIRLYNSEFDR
jgi:curved DNA-binding protein CbpA